MSRRKTIFKLLFGAGGQVDRSGDQGTLRKGPVIPGYCRSTREGRTCCKVTNSMPWGPKPAANCPLHIRAKGKQPFPLRRLLWFCCGGTSGLGKDVYNLCGDCVPGGIPFVCFLGAFRLALKTDHIHRCVYQHSPPVFSAGGRINSPSPAEHLIRSL